MLSVFRKNIYLQATITVMVAVALWSKSIIHPTPLPDGGGVLFHLLFDWMPLRLAAIVGLLLALLEGLLFNNLLFSHKFIGQNTLFPMLFFLLAMSFGSTQATLSPILVASLFLIGCVDQLMISGTYLSLTVDKTFGAAACLALSTLFCPATVVFIIPLIAEIFSLRLYSWHDITMIILGILAPYIIVETAFHLAGTLFYRNYLLFYDLTSVDFHANGVLADWIFGIVFIALALFTLITTILHYQNNTVNFSTNLLSILFFFLGSIAFALYAGCVPVCSSAYAIPFAFCCTLAFLGEKRHEWLWNLILMLFILSTFVYNILF